MDWYKLSAGCSVMRPITPAGHELTPENTAAIFNLRPGGIEYPDNFKTPQLYIDSDIKDFNAQTVKYRDGDEVITLTLGELLYYYDVAAGLEGNMLDSPSRIKPIKQSAANVGLSLDAENIMLQTNGREMFTAGGGKGKDTGIVLPMDAGDKKEIQDKLINVYGLARGKVRSIVTKHGVNYQSLHIALKELGLHESATKNAATIRSAFNIPETIFKLYMEGGDTFENKREGEVELVQNVGQVHMEDFCSTFNAYYGYEKEGKFLRASFSHLEAMQYVEQRRTDSVVKLSMAVKNFTDAGFNEQEIRDILAGHGVKI